MTRTEIERIRAEYVRRGQDLPSGFYPLSRTANLFPYPQENRSLLRILSRGPLLPLELKSISARTEVCPSRGATRHPTPFALDKASARAIIGA